MTSRGRFTFVAAAMLLAMLILAAVGCGSSDNGGGEDQPGTPIDAGLEGINLVGPETEGAGEVPVFQWEAVDGATRYRLVVLDGNGGTLWAWNGAETEVSLGGLPGERPEGAAGPIITAGSSWSVVAFDGSDNPLAASVIRPVSP